MCIISNVIAHKQLMNACIVIKGCNEITFFHNFFKKNNEILYNFNFVELL